MSNIGNMFSNDTELINTTKRFMFICLRAYVNALKMRYAELYENKLPPRNSGVIHKYEILEFFEACNALSKWPTYTSNIFMS